MNRDIIVIGASAGGVSALQTLVRALPPSLPAAVFVVLHVPSWAPSALPQILARSGPLPANHASDNQIVEYGRIYVAPPDYHLLLAEGRTVLWRGPKENRFRPGINTLFRSAAGAYRERVTGVILTGALDDGSAGLWWIHRYGGAAVVQEPDEAAVPDMPRSALAWLVFNAPGVRGGTRYMRTKNSIEATCPDCRGPLSVVREDSLVEIRCLVGHAYTAKALLTAHSETQEKALWSALVSLKETENIVEALADHLPSDLLAQLRSQVRKKQAQASVLQRILEDLEPFKL